MSVSETLSDQMCCNTAVAVEALAHASDLALVGAAGGNPVEAPSQGAFSGPALFSVGGSNPNSGLGIAVMDEQRPLGFEFADIAVGDDNGFERVDNNQIVLSQNQLGPNPEQSCCGTEGCCSGNLDADVALGVRVENYLDQEQGVEKQRDTSPDQIALRAINRQVLHLSIIAGTPADGKGK